MKKILICLLALVLLCTMAISVSADDEGESTEPGGTGELTFVPSEEHLPDGYEVDPDFSMTITLDEGNGWSVNLAEILEGAESDEYIYFLAEEEPPTGYTPNYAWGVAAYSGNIANGSVGTNGISGGKASDDGSTGGNIIVVTNVKEGEPPIYELPESGGVGAAVYTAVGAAMILSAAVYSMILRRKRKLNED